MAGPVLAGGLLLWAASGQSRRQAVRRFRAQLHHEDPMGLVHDLDAQRTALQKPRSARSLLGP